MTTGGVLVFEHESAGGAPPDHDGRAAQGQHRSHEGAAGQEDVMRGFAHARFLTAALTRVSTTLISFFASFPSRSDHCAEDVPAQRVHSAEDEEPQENQKSESENGECKICSH